MRSSTNRLVAVVVALVFLAGCSGAGLGEQAGGGGGPFTFEDLRPTLVEVGIPTGVVGAVTAYVGRWMAAR
jgi:hypothetical protein